VLLVPAALLIVMDQTTKVIVRQNLAVGEMWAPIPVLSKIFTITHVQNTGVAFGQMPGLGWLFMLVNVAVFIGVLVYYPRLPAGYPIVRLALALVLAGDLGNVVDRLRTAFLFASDAGANLWDALPHAYVTDFMDFKIWPVWNVADLCIVSGVAILAWTMWQAERQAAAKEQATGSFLPDDAPDDRLAGDKSSAEFAD